MAEDGSQSQTEGKKGGGAGKKVIGIVVVIIVLAAAGTLLAMKFGKKEEPEKKKDVITADNVADLEKEEPIPDNIPQNYTVMQNSEWYFPNGSSESTNAYVENSKDNETPIYFDLQVDQTGEIVYSSPILALGARIDKFALDTPLDKGEYVCTVIYHLVDEDENELTKVNIGVKVIVED